MTRDGTAIEDTCAPGLADDVLPDESGIRASRLPEDERASGRAPRYRRRELLGRGGMGDVHACDDARIGREIAVKTMRDARDASGVAITRFVREAQLQGRLEHPAIVPVYDLGTNDEGLPFFTMKRVRGETLAEVLDGLRAGDREVARKFSLRKLLTAIAQVCLAVDYAHRHGVVHRDLKPANVMLGRFGEVHVIDWGCAAQVDPLLHPGSAGVRSAGDIVGTPGYLSPEQARGKHACTRSDVYSLGALLFELLTLRPLHPAPTAVARVVATIQGVEGRPSRAVPGLAIAPSLDRLVERALSIDPEARPDARELADEIERVLDDEAKRMNERDEANRHAASARDAAASALLRSDDGSREIALREAGRALALDPGNELARDALDALLGRPPASIPAEAAEALARADRDVERSAARALTARVATWGVFAVLAIGLGVRDWVAGGVALGAIAALALVLLAVRATGATGRAPRMAIVGLTAIAIGALSGLFGPFVLVPVFAATSATAFALSYGRAERIAAGLLGVAVIAAPFALEVIGVLPPSMAITSEGILLLPRIVDFPPLATALFLVAGSTLAIPVGVMIAGRQREALDAARKQLAVQAWQLERLVPPRGAELSAGERRAASHPSG